MGEFVERDRINRTVSDCRCQRSEVHGSQTSYSEILRQIGRTRAGMEIESIDIHWLGCKFNSLLKRFHHTQKNTYTRIKIKRKCMLKTMGYN